MLTDSAQSPCALHARLSKLIQTHAHPPDSQMRTHACGRFRRTTGHVPAWDEVSTVRCTGSRAPPRRKSMASCR
eukprot:3286516-Prymnesium_polylepis.1